MTSKGKTSLAIGLIDQLLAVIRTYDAAADKFIKKVETGKAKSLETYADLKAARIKSSRINVTL